MGEGAEDVKTLTLAQVKALTILAEHGPLSPAQFAERMWPDSPAWHFSGPRRAVMGYTGGGYLGRLRRLGLVEYEHCFPCDELVHSISAEGRRALESQAVKTSRRA